ncbi:kremen protein 2-like [Ptychodera flava]|uniref:kremen protein 2-like n=1 Tax=Ptychodera flava TaxID=63121 RepID=UPI00396A44A8
MQCEGSEDKLQDCDFEVDLSCHCNQAKATCNYDGYDGCYEVVNCELSEEFVNDKMTIQLCLEYCRNNDFMLGMLQSGDRCICRDKDAKCDSWQRKENTRCYVPCGGDESQACGGNSIIAGVYNVQMGACGGHFTEDGGTIYSPGFPGFYTGNNHCTWAVGLVKDHVGLDFTISKISGDNDIIVFAEILDGSARIIDQRNKTWNPEQSIYSCSNEVMIGLQRKDGQGNSIFAIAYKGFSRCDDPGDVEHGEVITESVCPYRSGDYARVACRMGYAKNTTNTTIECEDGTWNGSLPECIKVAFDEEPEEKVSVGLITTIVVIVAVCIAVAAIGFMQVCKKHWTSDNKWDTAEHSTQTTIRYSSVNTEDGSRPAEPRPDLSQVPTSETAVATDTKNVDVEGGHQQAGQEKSQTVLQK